VKDEFGRSKREVYSEDEWVAWAVDNVPGFKEQWRLADQDDWWGTVAVALGQEVAYDDSGTDCTREGQYLCLPQPRFLPARDETLLAQVLVLRPVLMPSMDKGKSKGKGKVS